MNDSPRAADAHRRGIGLLELGATILIAIATVLTAWSAFQSTKWSGVQTNAYAAANTARTESAKASTLAGQEVIIDVNVFLQWLQALTEEQQDDPERSVAEDGTYQPDPNLLSGQLFERFREEFKPAVREWLDLRPLQNPDAPPVPFAMDSYVLADAALAEEFEHESEDRVAEARQANQRGDNYVLTTVLFATVLFFAGISSKFESLRNRTALLSFGVIVLVVGIGILATYPVEL